MTFCKPRIVGFSSLSTGQSPRAISLAMKILIYSFHIHIKSIHSFNLLHFNKIPSFYLFCPNFVLHILVFYFKMSNNVSTLVFWLQNIWKTGFIEILFRLSSRKRFVERQRIRQISLNFPKGLSQTFPRCLHEHGGVLYSKIIARRYAIRITLFLLKMSA